MDNLPPNWRVLPLGEVATLQRGFDLPVQDRIVGDYPVFAANGSVGAHAQAKVKGPGVVTGRSGSIGSVHFVEKDFWPLNTALWVKDFHGNDPEWVAYLLRWFDLSRFARGAAVPTLDRNLVHSELVPVPPSDQQRHIVARIKECFGRVDEIEELRRKSLFEAEAVLPSVLHSAFESLNGSTPRLSIGEFTKETRYGTSRKCHPQSEGVPILRIPNVAAGEVNFDALKYCDLPTDELERIRLENGDLLFVRTNGSRDLVGRSAVFKTPERGEIFGFASYLIRVRLDTRTVHPKFLSYFLNSTAGRDELNKRRRTSAGQFNINSENLRTIPVPVPPLSDQISLLHRLADRETHAVQLVARMRDSLSECAFLCGSILRKAFGGEL